MTNHLLIHNGVILTMDTDSSLIQNGYVLVSGNTIEQVGSGSPPSITVAQTLDAGGGIILPGLVNAHTHSAMTLFRGLGDDLPLMEWLERFVFPVEANMDEDFVHAGARLACAEMILSGTSCFCDMYLFEDAVIRAATNAGMRCVAGEVLYDFPSPNYGPIDEGFAYTKMLIEKWKDNPLVTVAVEPHAPYTCSPDLLRRAHEIAQTNNTPLIMHVAETENEVSQILEKYGKRPAEFLIDLGIVTANFIADHGVYLSEAEMNQLAEIGARVVFNPESNMKLASGAAPVSTMLKKGITVGLGTDGCASNNNLDLFGEMDTAAKLPKLDTCDPTAMDAATVLKMATIEGARALGLDHRIGSIETGKYADIIVIDTRKPHLTPMYHPASHLVYSANGADVIHSVIHGQIVMRDRRLLTLDVKETMARAREKADQVRRWVY